MLPVLETLRPTVQPVVLAPSTQNILVPTHVGDLFWSAKSSNHQPRVGPHFHFVLPLSFLNHVQATATAKRGILKKSAPRLATQNTPRVAMWTEQKQPNLQVASAVPTIVGKINYVRP